MINLYHYCEFSKWPNIKSNGIHPKSRQSLSREVGDFSDVRATFSLLKPAPTEWTNDTFPTLWDAFIGTRGDLLLKIKADENDPKILVGDAGYIEGYLYRAHHDSLQVPDRYKINNSKEAYRLYTESLVPIAKYISDRAKYLLPEVQIRRIIQEGMFEVCELQPILETEVGNGVFPDLSIFPLPDIFRYRKDLQGWLKDEFAKKPLLEKSLQACAEKMQHHGIEY